MKLRYGDLAPESVLISAQEMMEREDFRRAGESLDRAITSETVIRTVTDLVKDRIAVEARVRVMDAREVRGRVAIMVVMTVRDGDGVGSEDASIGAEADFWIVYQRLGLRMTV